MKSLSLSRAASGLIRVLLATRINPENRILLIDVRSVDWQSLTFTGERHELTLRLVGPEARSIAEGMINALPNRDFCISGSIVAEIAGSLASQDGHDSVLVAIEALTINES